MTDLPAGWTSAALGELCGPVAKWNPRELPDAELTYIDIGGIDSHRIVDTKVYRGRDAPSRARQLVRAGDTVLSTVRTYLKKTALVPPTLDGATASTGFCVLRPCMLIDAKYLFHRVTADDFVASLSMRQTGSSYPAVRDSDVRAETIALPPLAEQQWIVATIEEQFSRLDAASDLLGLARRRLTALRTWIVDERAAATSPVKPLSEVIDEPLLNGRSVPSADDGFPVLRLSALKDGKVDFSEAKLGRWTATEAQPFLVRKGDFLVARGNGSLRLVGRGGLVDGDPPEIAFPDLLIRVRVDSAVLDARYLRLIWDSRFVRTQLESRARTSAGIYKVNQVALRDTRIPVPPLAEQQHIVAETQQQLSLIDSLLTAVESAHKRSAALRRAILERAFRGELVAQDPEDEPASVLLERIRAERAAAPKPNRRKRMTA